MRALAALLAFALCAAACVPVPEDMMDEVAPASSTGSSHDSSPFAPLDAGASENDGLHFKVHAYGQDTAARIEQDAESSFGRLTNDAGLMGFQPGKPYDIVVYGSQNEFHSKTQQPAASDGIIVGTALYTYYGSDLSQTMAHHIAHLVMREYFGSGILRSPEYRWIEEGLACYEENTAARAAGKPDDIFATYQPLLRSQPLALTQIQQMPPNVDYGRAGSMWYAESESMISFLLLRQRAGFPSFLQSVRDGHTPDQSIARAYQGTFIDLNAFYTSWQSSLTQ